MSIAHERGRWGEEMARIYLASCGYRVLAQRFRRAHGEVDLIVRQREYLVFVEVKTRGPRSVAFPEAAVSRRKLWRLRRVARSWLAERGWEGATTGRFDVVAVEFHGEGQGCVLRHLRDVTR